MELRKGSIYKYSICNVLSGAAARTLLVRKKMTRIYNNTVVDGGVKKTRGNISTEKSRKLEYNKVIGRKIQVLQYL